MNFLKLTNWALILSGPLTIVVSFYVSSILIFAIKDALVLFISFILFLLILIKKENIVKLSVENMVILLFVLYLFGRMEKSVGAIASIRQIIIPFLLIFVGYASAMCQKNIGETNLNSHLKKILGVLLLAGFFDLAFNLFSGMAMSYFELKNIGILDNQVPAFWNEPIPEYLKPYLNVEYIRRNVSLLLDPINLGHSLVFLVLIAKFERGERVAKIISMIGIILTFSKGAYLQYLLIQFKKNRFQNEKYKIVRIVIIPIFISFFIFYVINHPGFIIHLSGLISSIINITLFGHGLGNVGNYSVLLGVSLDESIGDSFWGSIIGQIGLVGFVYWIAVWLMIIKKLKDERLIKLTILSQLLIGALSENSLNTLSMFLVLGVTGYKIGSEKRYAHKNN